MLVLYSLPNNLKLEKGAFDIGQNNVPSWQAETTGGLEPAFAASRTFVWLANYVGLNLGSPKDQWTIDFSSSAHLSFVRVATVKVGCCQYLEGAETA